MIARTMESPVLGPLTARFDIEQWPLVEPFRIGPSPAEAVNDFERLVAARRFNFAFSSAFESRTHHLQKPEPVLSERTNELASPAAVIHRAPKAIHDVHLT